ncbi:hypothetical protein BDY21DRAFT_334110 [Lineolata rhizophorae]|uniref:TPR domain-containing protein n=1 Tax=Lineolata rhizophorae TaxID=578093 RepID=A0A6A6PAM1_9PEZI|nr:hypothetical protein BDY21DRAFT_334110 [Lineolata rhizophorae]
MVELYMTDLSWEDDAEAQCETLVAEALLVAPDRPEPLQTLASVRISQLRPEEARTALARSMELWKDLAPEDPLVPDYATRISLSRLLMEAGMEDEALEVLERLVLEDDQSVEAWYLGGWCQYLMAQKAAEALQGKGKADENTDEEVAAAAKTRLKQSKDWLENSLKLYALLEYEDDRLKDHAEELVGEIKASLGDAGEEEGSDDGEWEDAEDEEDEEMEGT